MTAYELLRSLVGSEMCMRDGCRAGWAVVQEGGGQESKVLFGPVWRPLPQTSQAAEWVAWAVAHQLATGSAVLHSDCSSVTNAHGLPLLASLRPGAYTQLTLPTKRRG